MTAQIGTVSEGTLRSEDLLRAFAWELRYQAGRKPLWSSAHMLLAQQADNQAERIETDDVDEGDAQRASELVEECAEALQNYAPAFSYFGTLEGDGADFGFWPDRDRIQAAIEESQGVEESGAEAGTFINEDEGVRIVVSDHGNIEVYSLADGSTLLSLV